MANEDTLMAEKQAADAVQSTPDPNAPDPVTPKDSAGNAAPNAAEAVGAGEVQARMDEETDKGYRGTRTDPTPLDNYTVKGVTSGAPTPETDPDMRRQARAALNGEDVPAPTKKGK